MDPLKTLESLFQFQVIDLSKLYETLIEFNISLSEFIYIMLFLFCISLGVMELSRIQIEYRINVSTDKLNTILKIILGVCYVGFVLLSGFFTLNSITGYENYLKHQLNKTSYTVTKLSYDKKTALTPKNKQIKIQNSKIKTIKEPTNDKNKIGKIYYTVDVYDSDKIANLLKINRFNYTEYQNQLVKHVYIDKYQNLPTNTK